MRAARLPERYSCRQLFANAAIAASCVGSYPRRARQVRDPVPNLSVRNVRVAVLPGQRLGSHLNAG
jgi:hypothetical protein